ncbi:MAG: HAMP domain-containing histidine kinase [Clostridia bacterium]|nr:HAMP domain-containing histidine kinase [Clostridia bacterium]
MRRQGLFARFFWGTFAVVLLSLFAAGAIQDALVQRYFVNARERELLVRGQPLAAQLGPLAEAWQVGREDAAADLRKALSVSEGLLEARAVLVGRNGATMTTATGAGAGMRHRGASGPPPEESLPADTWTNVLTGQTVTGVLRSPGGRLWVTAALPVRGMDGRVQAALVLLTPTAGVRGSLLAVRRLLLTAAAVGAMLSALLAWLLSRRLIRPLAGMASLLEGMAAGDFRGRLAVRGEDELAHLAILFNRAAEALERARAQQEALDRSRRDLIAHVSHEFRAPLTSLRGFVELLGEGAVRGEDRAEVLRYMAEDVERLDRLVTDLLDLSRLESGAPGLRTAAVDARAAAERAARGLAERAERGDVALVVEAPDEEALTFHADPDRVQQVLVNLLDNALRHTPTGGRVTLAVDREDDGIAFEVRDTGSGLDPSLQQRVWEPFYRGDPARTPRAGEGAGLGLAIVRQIVELHGGRVACGNRPEGGAWFRAVFPIMGPAGKPEGPAAQAAGSGGV